MPTVLEAMQWKVAEKVPEVTQSQGYTEESIMKIKERFKNLELLFVSIKSISQSAIQNIPVLYFQ